MDCKRVLLLVAGLLAGTILSVLLYKVLDMGNWKCLQGICW